jgi:hypothetical protein
MVEHFMILISYPMILLAFPIFEQMRGYIPISMFGNPFVITGTEIQTLFTCPEKVQNIYFIHLKIYH